MCSPFSYPRCAMYVLYTLLVHLSYPYDSYSTQLTEIESGVGDA